MNEKQILKPCRLSLQEQNRIIQLYVNNNLSIQQIVKQTHHSSITISKVLHNHGIDVGLGLKQYKPTLEEIEKVKQIINNHGSIREASRIIGRDQTIIKRIIQDNSEATYAPIIKREDEKLDFNKTSFEACKILVAFFNTFSIDLYPSLNSLYKKLSCISKSPIDFDCDFA